MKVLEEVLIDVEQLSPLDKVRLMERLAASLLHNMQEESPKPRKSLYGICADLGTAPSAEEIDEARQEIWANFPREDI